MDSNDLTIEILKQIRDGVTERLDGVTDRLDGVTEGLAGVTDRLDGVTERLDHATDQLDGMNVRLDRVEHGLNDLEQFMRQIALDQARHERFHVHHVELLEKDVAGLAERVRRLEERSRP